jgi:hypothetical protein
MVPTKKSPQLMRGPVGCSLIVEVPGSVRTALLIAVLGALALESARAQTASQGSVGVAERFLAGQLSDSGFRSRACVAAGSGDCPGGVQIVQGYRLGRPSWTKDTVRYTVEYQVAGIVGVSEAAPFFMPRSWVDSGAVLVVRRGAQWLVRSPGDHNDEPVRTTADVARRYFDLDATDHSLLDSAVTLPGRP